MWKMDQFCWNHAWKTQIFESSTIKRNKLEYNFIRTTKFEITLDCRSYFH
ncbi:hypothetical protein Pint_10235 [Pistacia integerrima]|uniref:Uncharacterized protein n=1 Tax=Pistacia integerrima TaxID=434235 RepID=A0ACC0XH04_9ROSI|nr:hypothetical protein Pint_10235 [Pistacia integerrima]